MAGITVMQFAGKQAMGNSAVESGRLKAGSYAHHLSPLSRRFIGSTYRAAEAVAPSTCFAFAKAVAGVGNGRE